MTDLDWMRRVEEGMSGGSRWSCQHEHSAHGGHGELVKLDGWHERIPDYPPVPSHLRAEFEMCVWDWEPMLNLRVGTKKYCPQDDIVSECVQTQGVWEGYGTNLALDILRSDAPGVTIDCGSQIGWYSLLSLSSNRLTLSIDADMETIGLLRKSVEGNGWLENWVYCWAGLDADSPVIDALPADRVRFMKMDIEGAENHAVRVFEPLLAAHMVDYLMMEVSPCFDDYYPDLCVQLRDQYGLIPHAIPTKGIELEAFGSQPLESILPYRIADDELAEWVANCVQRDVLFILEN